jgi:hypothetical protein
MEAGMMRAMKILSAIVWGALGVVFGLGLILAGAQALPHAGGIFTLCLGLVIAGAAYGLHRATCWALAKSHRATSPA